MIGYQYHLVPVFTDNYVFIVENTETKKCVIVDPGAADEVISFLQRQQLQAEAIFITHHHWDHIDGLGALLAFIQKSNATASVYAPLKNRSEVSQATQYVGEDDLISAIGLSWKVMELPGHTLGHISYYSEDLKWLFSGDVLFGLGCGRLFEGTYEQQFNSLKKIKSLGAGVKVFCTHEYTERNLAFCKHLVLSNKEAGDENLRIYEQNLTELRALRRPSVPLELSEELKCNPFLLADTVEKFTELRQLRNKF